MIAINYKNRRQTILNNWITAIKHHQKNIKNLPITVKILIILSLIITIILIGSIIYLRSQHKQEESKQIFNSTVQQIKDQRDTAEKTLIYNDTETAFSELQSAKTLLAKLDCVDKERQLTCQNLSKDLEKIIDKVRKLYTITPQLIDDWSKTDQQLKTNSLMQIDKKIIGFSNDSSQIIEYNLLDKTSKIVATNIGNNGFTTVAVPKENDYAIAVYDNNKMARYDAKKSIWEKIDIDYQNSNTSIAGAFVYSRRLYTLDSNNSQIYRHDAIPTGFGRGKEWITDNSALDLGKSIDLAIDGDLYTVTTDGKLYKFSAGVLQDFSIAGLDPVLDSASAIWTYYELNYIYILDTKNKRLIIINKLDGSLKKQLTAVEFVNPTDMVVDETNSTAYILDSNKLYKIDLGL